MTTLSDGAPMVIHHQIGTTGQLVIRLASAELRLAATDGDRVVVRTPVGRSLPDRVLVETQDGSLTIREKEGFGISFGRGRATIQLEIDVPSAASVSIDTASGWLDAQGLTGSQSYRTAAGQTRLRAGAGSIDLTSVSGDTTIGLAGGAELAIKTVSGDVEVGGGRLASLRVQTTSGDVRIHSPLVGRTGNAIETLSGDVDLVAGAGMRVQARTVSGDLSTDLPHRSEGRMGRRTLIVGDGDIELAFRSVSGDLRIRGTGAPLVPRPPEPPIALTFGTLDDDVAADDGAGSDAPAPDIRAVESTAGATIEDPLESERMTILRALEGGDLDVATALDRLAALDLRGDGPADDGGDARG